MEPFGKPIVEDGCGSVLRLRDEVTLGEPVAEVYAVLVLLARDELPVGAEVNSAVPLRGRSEYLPPREFVDRPAFIRCLALLLAGEEDEEAGGMKGGWRSLGATPSGLDITDDAFGDGR